MNKSVLLVGCLLASGCSPLAVDFTVGWGANQTIKKNLEFDQKQTKAQTESQTEIIGDIVDVIWKKEAAPTPTPLPPKIKSVTIELAGQEKPTPTPVVKKLATKADCEKERLAGYVEGVVDCKAGKQ